MKTSASCMIAVLMVFTLGCSHKVRAEYDPEVAVNIQVDRKGDIRITDNKGMQLSECSVGPSDKLKRCPGFDRNGEVLKAQHLHIFRTRGSSCVVSILSNGAAVYTCW